MCPPRCCRDRVAVAVFAVTVTATMDASEFRRRAETFGFDTPEPWALWALRLLFHVPRAYMPLVEAWDDCHPGAMSALNRLVADGWVSYQPGVVIDLRTGEPASRPSRPVDRYVTTAAGRRLLAEAQGSLVTLTHRWPQLSDDNAVGLRQFLNEFALEDSHARYGLSVPHAADRSQLADRTARWWAKRLLEEKLIRRLDERWPDVREIVPAHWRLRRDVCRQLSNVLSAFGAEHQTLRNEWTLSKTRFLADIDPARVGISGATDFDHDIEAQRLCARLLLSPRSTPNLFDIEPKYTLKAQTGRKPVVFGDGDGLVFYQPDAVLSAADNSGRVRRVVVEYERFQSRRDAWSHIERFCAWVSATLLPFESATLCFVVDSEPRLRGYVELIEAFADWAMEHPQTTAPNPLVLAVSSIPRVNASPDPLDDRAWFRVPMPPGTGERLVLHDPSDSPYDAFFSRKAPL